MTMTLQSAAPSFFFLLVLFVPSLLMLEAWVPAATPRVPRTVSVSKRTLLFQSSEQEGNDDIVDRTSFDQAGRSLIEEEDQKRMEQMGDFDSNPAYQTDSIEKMRAAIRARTQELGLEKSKVSAEYIQAKAQKAMQDGAASMGESNDSFGGLDLSKISQTSTSSGTWDEDMPTILYDPEDEMTQEEKEEADPIMTQNPIEQGLYELSNAKWPTLGAALRQVVLMIGVVVFSAVLIIGWDKILREVYTSLGFIPSKEDIANYASRFDGLDLPKGWTDNMNEQDISQFADSVNQATSAAGSLPDLQQ